ncbi:SapC family protein [Alkalimonas mucilaginosa]|uniref:SapC family protein n=1 Tax=Alkalimonas mucilaginosa TaxID=3057676 RepID=A0ABU7JGM0_9GAMM|nr:SapC family protein [Alkalimonas sp. MEB004]MEE2024844.1 SapC family protein [Alkalimonas sp. MEB004]
MSKHVLLNSVEHLDLKVITSRGAEFGDNVWFTPTFPQEFRSVQAHYPIFFHKDAATGQFFSVAVFGFTHQENLFLQDNNWQGYYLPLTVRRHPFLIGKQAVVEDGVEHIQHMIHLDLDSPRVNKEQGEALFLPLGGSSPYLDDVSAMLQTIHQGLQDNTAFIDLLLQHKLLESFTLDIQLDDGSKHQMMGFYTINEDSLAALPAEVLAQLHNQGYLEAIYMAIASQSNIRSLLRLKNQLNASTVA